MVNATAMVVSEGWKYLTNTTQLNIVNASISMWKTTGEGVGGYLVFGSLILMAMAMALIRGMKATAVASITILVTLIVDHYDLLNYYTFVDTIILKVVYIIAVIVIGAELYSMYKDW